MQPFEQLLLLVKDTCRHSEAVADETMTPKGVKVDAADLTGVCETLYRHPSFFFDMLSCITAVDNGPDIGTIDLVYTLYSIPFNHSLALKVVVTRDSPVIDSVSPIWRTANWHEREAYDLLGVTFNGHPDLRRILLPADWEGHPLRKDYKHQEYYRGIKVEY